MAKSKLIHVLNKLAIIQPLPQDDELPKDRMDTKTPNVPILIGGMALLQQMAKKPEIVATVKGLSECYNNKHIPRASL